MQKSDLFLMWYIWTRAWNLEYTFNIKLGYAAKHDNQGLDIIDFERGGFEGIVAKNTNVLICCTLNPAAHMPNVKQQIPSINYQSPVRT